jgi:hypothetical protein
MGFDPQNLVVEVNKRGKSWEEKKGYTRMGLGTISEEEECVQFSSFEEK